MIFAEKTPPHEKTFLGDLIDKGFIRNIETNYLSKDGRKIPVFLSGATMLRDDGRVQGFVFVALDITERKWIEKKLRISSKMASIGRLTGGVFHEVLNPVNIISAHVQLLLMEAEKGSTTKYDNKCGGCHAGGRDAHVINSWP